MVLTDHTSLLVVLLYRCHSHGIAVMTRVTKVDRSVADKTGWSAAITTFVSMKTSMLQGMSALDILGVASDTQTLLGWDFALGRVGTSNGTAKVGFLAKTAKIKGVFLPGIFQGLGIVAVPVRQDQFPQERVHLFPQDVGRSCPILQSGMLADHATLGASTAGQHQPLSRIGLCMCQLLLEAFQVPAMSTGGQFNHLHVRVRQRPQTNGAVRRLILEDSPTHVCLKFRHFVIMSTCADELFVCHCLF